MPSMADITVKKADGTTDIVFSALVAASGFDPAAWRQDTGQPAGVPNGLRPFFKLSSKWNGPRTARQLIYEIGFPYFTQDTTTSIYSAKDRVVITALCTIPQAIPAGSIAEAVSQGFNLISSSLSKNSALAGYAPV